MTKLPDEDVVRRSIRSDLHQEFDLAGRLLDFAASIFTTDRVVYRRPGVDKFVAVVALGLMAKMCKQYRGILALAELGLGGDAESLTRMHFESMLAMQFILRPRVKLKDGKKPLPPVPGKPLTTRFRARLYLANAFFNNRKITNCVRETDGIKRTIGVAMKRGVDAEASAWEAEIGAEWTERLKKRGYSGLSVEHLACSLHYRHLYNSVYRIASSGAHANDGLDFAEFVEHDRSLMFKVVPSRVGVASALKFASLFLILAVRVVDQRLGFGMEGEAARFAVEISRMRTTDHE